MAKSLLDRRAFLKDASALTVSAALAASGASAGASVAPAQGRRISAVLFDGRYSCCREFANSLTQKGAIAFNVYSDVAALWHGPLRDRLTKHGGCVAGLTAHSDLTVSRSFGREFRLALRYEGAHDSRGAQVIAHRLRAPVRIDHIASALQCADVDWSESLANAMARILWQQSTAQWESSVAQTSAHGDHPGFLSSWLLAPPEKV
ncbi:MAG TPA: hypothetical protein VMD78_13620 [Candidatus Baltobacteraceae bacterium]|nr:hypothetical protein [Candidatus Baltobacteraceae bacterium]